MSTKRKLSIELHKVLEPVLKEYLGSYKLKSQNTHLLHLIDSDTESDFFFLISKETTSAGNVMVEFGCKPLSSSKIGEGYKSTTLQHIAAALKVWFENIKYYQQPSLLDDPILAGYEEEFFQDFKIMDEDADVKPFSYDQQLSITRFLDAVTNTIDQIKDGKNDSLVDEIKQETDELKNNITTQTKNDFIKDLGKIIAKARKGGLKISNFMLNEFAKEVIKEGAKTLFNYAAKHAASMPEYIDSVIQIGQSALTT